MILNQTIFTNVLLSNPTSISPHLMLKLSSLPFVLSGINYSISLQPGLSTCLPQTKVSKTDYVRTLSSFFPPIIPTPTDLQWFSVKQHFNFYKNLHGLTFSISVVSYKMFMLSINVKIHGTLTPLPSIAVLSMPRTESVEFPT